MIVVVTKSGQRYLVPMSLEVLKDTVERDRPAVLPTVDGERVEVARENFLYAMEQDDA